MGSTSMDSTKHRPKISGGKCYGVGDVYDVVRLMTVVSILSIYKLFFLVIIS